MAEWSDSIKLAVDVMVACIVILAMIVCGDLAKSVMVTMEQEQVASEEVKEYRVQRLYDNQECYSSDVINVILEYQGNPAVYVTHSDLTTVSWSKTSRATALTSAAINEKLKNVKYFCTLEYDSNGSLIAYNFEEVI